MYYITADKAITPTWTDLPGPWGGYEYCGGCKATANVARASRYYNWKDSRVSDHRLGQNFPLDNFIGGDIGPAIGGCQAMEQQEMLEELNSEMSM